jgi:hypothetical protein
MTVTLASATGPGPGRIVQYLVSYAGRQYFVSIETVQTHGGTKPRFSLEIQRFPPPAHGPVELMRPRPDFTSPRQALRSAEDRIRRGHWQGRI